MKSKAIKEELDAQRKKFSKLSKVNRCVEYSRVKKNMLNYLYRLKIFPILIRKIH